jgi:hypothetical protein
MRMSSIKSLFLFVFILSLSACASLPDQQNLNLRAEQIAQTSSKSSQSLLQQAKRKLQKSHTESLAFYAPTYLEQAQLCYNDASMQYKQKEQDSEIKLNAQRSIEWVEAGLRNKKMVLEYLSASLANRKVLIDIKADKHFPDDFKKITAQQIKLIKQIEQRQEVKAQKDEKALIVSMQALEVATIGQVYLKKSYLMLKQAQALDAQKYLPRTYLEATVQLKSTEEFIHQNPRDKKNIQGLAKDSLFITERLFSLARFAQKIQTAKESTLEALILKQEQLFERIAQSLNYQDIRNLSLEDQSLLLSQYGENLNANKYAKTSNTQNKAELEKWKRKVALLQAEVRRLKIQ